MATLLVKNATILATFDETDTEIVGGGMFIRDGWIEAVGPSESLPTTADEAVDLTDHVVLPGLVNTHHHLYQTLTRAVPAAQNAGLFDWLTTLYPMWARMTPADVTLATTVGLVELALSGCTTVFDHHYIWPNGARLDDQMEAAGRVGVRFHGSRGSMSLGESDGGLPPDVVVESEDAILADYTRVTDAFHDPEPGAMRRVVVAPCSPFSVTPDLMRESAAWARAHGVRLHTHLAETADEESFCLDEFGARPLAYAEQLDWAGDDVWFAHAVHVDGDEVARMAAAGTGVAHCPTSNMRLASGIAPVPAYVTSGVPVGLGVDGSASNDSSHMLAEVRQAVLLNRLAVSPGVGSGSQMTAREALRLATVGGAAVLGRGDIGALRPGMTADFIAVDLNRIEFAGALHDPVAAVVFCTPPLVDHSYVHGRAVVREGRPVGIELEPLIAAHNESARRIVDGD